MFFPDTVLTYGARSVHLHQHASAGVETTR